MIGCKIFVERKVVHELVCSAGVCVRVPAGRVSVPATVSAVSGLAELVA